MFVHHSCVTKSIKRNCAITFYLLPVVFLVLDVTSVKVVEARLSIVTSKNIHRTRVIDACVVSSLTGPFTRGSDLGPLLEVEIVVKEIVVVVS